MLANTVYFFYIIHFYPFSGNLGQVLGLVVNKLTTSDVYLPAIQPIRHHLFQEIRKFKKYFGYSEAIFEIYVYISKI